MSTATKLSGYSQSVTVPMPTEYGEFSMTAFTDQNDGKEHILLVMGDLLEDLAPVVRIHSECATGDLFGSKRCDCGAQLNYSLKRISEEGCGVLLYLRQEGRGIGLTNKLMAYQLQDRGLDTVDANLQLGFKADERRYDLAAAILKSMNLLHIRLLTNNPAKVDALIEQDIRVAQRVPIEVGLVKENAGYLETKKQRMGHFLMSLA